MDIKSLYISVQNIVCKMLNFIYVCFANYIFVFCFSKQVNLLVAFTLDLYEGDCSCYEKKLKLALERKRKSIVKSNFLVLAARLDAFPPSKCCNVAIAAIDQNTIALKQSLGRIAVGQKLP